MCVSIKNHLKTTYFFILLQTFKRFAMLCRLKVLRTSPPQLRLARKLHYQDSTGSTNMFYNGHPTLDNEIKYAKRIQDLMQGITVLQLLITVGAGLDIIPDILKWLTFTEFTELEAALELFGCSLRRFVLENANLARRIVVENHFALMKHQKHSPDINFEYLWGLSPDELLLESRRLSFTEPIYTIDHGIVALKVGPPKPKVAFNPVHELIAVAIGRSLQVVAYGGPVREDRGQILYYKPDDKNTDPCYFSLRDIACLSWSPTGDYLVLIIDPMEKNTPYDRELIIFKYYSTTFQFKRCLHAGLDLKGDGSMLSPSMWTDGNSFLWTKGPEEPLMLITITKRNELVAKSLCDNVQSLFSIPNIVGAVTINLDIHMRETVLGQQIAWHDPEDLTSKGKAGYGNIFSTFGINKKYFYCVMKCPTHQDKHDCVAVFTRTCPPKFEYIILIPGHVVEVRTLEHNIFILYSRLDDLYSLDKNELTKLILPKLFYNCFFKFRKNIAWYKTSVNVLWFTDLNLEPQEISKTCCPVQTSHLYRYSNRSVRQRALFEARLDLACLTPTDHYLGLCLEGAPGSSDTIGDLDCICSRIFLKHHLVDVVKRTPWETPTYVFPHPKKPIVYTVPFFNGKTAFVSITADAKNTDIMSYSEHTRATPHHCSIQLPLVESTSNEETTF